MRISWRLLPPPNRMDIALFFVSLTSIPNRGGSYMFFFGWWVFMGYYTLEPHLCALHQFLEVPQKHWLPAVEGTVLASVDAFYFLHRVRFGGLPAGGLLGTGLGQADLGEDTSDSDLDESRMVRGRCKRGSSWSHGGGTTSQRGSK